jgi:hypothetical protein
MKNYKNNTNEHLKKPIKGKEMNKQTKDAQRKRKKKKKERLSIKTLKKKDIIFKKTISRKDEHSSWTLQKKKNLYLRHLLWS